MAKDGEKSDGRPPSPYTDPTSPYFLHPSSNLGSVLTQIKLKGENYSAWEQAIILALRSQNKLGFIDGSIVTPDKSDSRFVTWEIVNSMLCSWIANSLDDSIRATVSRLSNVKILWECLKNRYSVKNGPKVYKVWSDLTLTKQAGASVMSYYTQFLGMWEDLSNISPLETCTCDSGSSIATWFRNLQTYQFLMGLDDSYSVLRTQIINIEPLPDLDRVYAMVSQEESHRSALQPRDNSPAVGFAVQSKASSSSSSSTTTVSSPTVSSGRPYCTFCERQGHVFDKCWTRLGISPASNRGRGRGRGRHSSQSRVPAFAAAAQWATQTPADAPSSASSSVPPVGIPGLTADQVQRLLALIESSPENDKMSGKISHDVSWLIDSGASHHMTGNISLLSHVRDILPSPVGLPDGEKTSAVKEGSCVIQSGLTLHHVLFVPNLAVNLISVSKLICDANCFVTFTDRLCILQDRTTRSPIGLGYPHGKKGWKVMDLESKKMIISRDVKFDENTFPFATSQSQSSSTPFPTIIGSDWSWTSLACDNVTPFHELGGASVTTPHTRSSTDTATPLSPVPAPSPMPLSDTDAVHRDSLMTASDIAAPSLGRGHRVRKPPSHLHDYVCHTVQFPLSSAKGDLPVLYATK
ncbi:hypothetical protein MRB53_014747 [Persea americana]|uniref:Uncharacterized protein n=1 Tax=Persea americana TaxID=3435 RepID=A0ACC2KC19_PERAE|nr:hypothetical protein MRB53_014747 [Persea americana]